MELPPPWAKERRVSCDALGAVGCLLRGTTISPGQARASSACCVLQVCAFPSRDDYKIHTSSARVKEWADKYLFNPETGLFDGMFEFHNLVKKVGLPAGGFDRS